MKNEPIKPGMPFSNSAIAAYLDKQIDALRGRKTQREIASETGYTRPNIISMFKRGETKVPLDKIPALAKALEADPAHLFRLGVEQYWPGISDTVRQIFGSLAAATTNEEEIILTKWRAATKNMNPGPSARTSAAIDKMLKELFGAQA